MLEMAIGEKENNLPTGLESVSNQNVDSVDYIGTLSSDEKKEIANGLNTSTKRKESKENVDFMGKKQ